jgi:hypothetical protein
MYSLPATQLLNWGMPRPLHLGQGDPAAPRPGRLGAGFSLQRFHSALLSLGSPPLGLLAAALDARA